MADARSEKTKLALKEALLEILESKNVSEVTVSEVSRKAGISRSTFYCHFQNVLEVFEILIVDFNKGIRRLDYQLKCSSCTDTLHTDGKIPYCMAVRTTKKYASVVKDPLFLTTMIRLLPDRLHGDEALSPYLKLGLDKETAQVLFTFQMTGCHAAATAAGNCDWEEKRRLLDAFIAGGMNSIRAKS